MKGNPGERKRIRNALTANQGEQENPAGGSAPYGDYGERIKGG